jgi:hypothetical protein
MANKNQDNQKSGSKSSMGSSPGSDREFESQGKNPGSGKGDQGRQAGTTDRQGSGSQRNMDDDDMNTAGGRQGAFSETDREKEGQWSPGSTQSSDQ